MLHPVPKSTVIDREASILKHCEGKHVLEFGASGKLTHDIQEIAANYCGVNRVTGPRVIAWDLDDFTPWPLNVTSFEPDIIVAGEVIEHLTNPGLFLDRVRTYFTGVPVIITTPNCFALAATRHMEDGVENVNIDHVAWYSYTTLKTLLTRYGFAIEAFHWYKGEPYTAEGMLVVARA